MARLNLPSRKLSTRKCTESALTALVPTPFKPDRELEDVVVVLAAGVDLGDALDHLAERDAAAVVAHRDGLAVARDLDAAAGAHDEFVDRVVDDLLEQHVDAVVGVGAVADPADVHAGAQPDVRQRVEGLDRLFVVGDAGARSVVRRVGSGAVHAS